MEPICRVLFVEGGEQYTTQGRLPVQGWTIVAHWRESAHDIGQTILRDTCDVAIDSRIATSSFAS